jgi:hypothetical protein
VGRHATTQFWVERSPCGITLTGLGFSTHAYDSRGEGARRATRATGCVAHWEWRDHTPSVHRSEPWARPEKHRVADAVIKARQCHSVSSPEARRLAPVTGHTVARPAVPARFGRANDLVPFTSSPSARRNQTPLPWRGADSYRGVLFPVCLPFYKQGLNTYVMPPKDSFLYQRKL